MKIISTCLFLLSSALAFSQFNRTFLHASGSNPTTSFSSYAREDAQKEVDLFTFIGRGFSELYLLKEHISALGDLETFDEYIYTVNMPATTQEFFLMTAIESGNERYYVLGISSSNTVMRLLWLKVDKTSGALISTLTGTTDYKLAYFEPKLVGNQLVTYVVKSTGSLVRVALNTGTFTAPTQETVSASITTVPSYVNTVLSGYKTGNLFVVNGLEKVVLGAGVSSATIFTRTAASNYTSVTTGIATNRSVSSFLIDSTTIGVSNGAAIEHYDAAGTMINSGTFTAPPNSNTSQIEYKDNTYHLYYKGNNTNAAMFYRANQNFQSIDSISTVMFVYHMLKNPNGMLLVGSHDVKGLSWDLNDHASYGQTVYCEAYSKIPKLTENEYWSFIKSLQNLRVWTGMGTKVITNPAPAVGGAFHNAGISTCYNLSEHFVGFIGANDTISNAKSDFSNQYNELPGPFTTSGMYDPVIESKYNRPYHVTMQMILDHIDSVQSGSSTYLPVWEIRNWPAHGNTALGQTANLAPFADINTNGVYEPLLGDYPTIYGTDCVFSITHYRTSGDDSKALEFHSYIYTQSCDTTESFDDVLMRKIQIYSRGAVIDSLFFGGRFDGDLGNSNDDYAGTNVDLGMVYNYNSDLFDEDNSGRIGFHDTLAAQGVMVLKGFKQANDGLDNGIGILPGQSVNGYGYNDGITDNEYTGLYSGNVFTGAGASPSVSDPATAEEWYHLFTGYFRFGDTVFYGGTGFSGDVGTTTIPTRYMYSGGEDSYNFGTGGISPGFNWSEMDPGGTGSTANPGGDRRNAYSFGKTALSNGEFVELDYAYLFKRQNAPAVTLFEPVTDLFVKAAAVRSAFLSNNGPCGINFDPISESLGIEESVIEGDLFTVYPNPTTGLVRINGISETGGTIQIFDMNGKLLQTVTNYQAMQNLDLSELQGNMFILQISSESKTAQKRVVKY
nr:T9SS type A sorting domain-containing protein [uncultured Fluviicola sp.]